MADSSPHPALLQRADNQHLLQRCRDSGNLVLNMINKACGFNATCLYYNKPEQKFVVAVEGRGIYELRPDLECIRWIGEGEEAWSVIAGETKGGEWEEVPFDEEKEEKEEEEWLQQFRAGGKETRSTGRGLGGSAVGREM